jgi:arsenite methyltransferase
MTLVRPDGTSDEAQNRTPSTLKQCCAAAYESEAAKLLLGDSFHPGGRKLTERLGQILNLSPRTRVLDVAAGKGTSALLLAERFGCEIVGVDYSRRNVEEAERQAKAVGLDSEVSFQFGDAEQLAFPDSSFDAIICECALCTFPDKAAAAREFTRTLRPDGRVGLTDLTRQGPLAPDLDNLPSWIACVADAQPLASYVTLLSAAGLVVEVVERHDEALTDLVSRIRTRLLATDVLVRLQKLALPGFDLEAAKNIAKYALAAINAGKLGYAIIAGVKAK